MAERKAVNKYYPPGISLLIEKTGILLMDLLIAFIETEETKNFCQDQRKLETMIPIMDPQKRFVLNFLLIFGAWDVNNILEWEFDITLKKNKLDYIYLLPFGVFV
jgi:hypothetical protein